jgi:hypothetical protein
MAYYPPTGQIYVFGGYDSMGNVLDDLWAWNGQTWAEVPAAIRPSARADAALAYDPARKSLILFGGTSYYGKSVNNDTWEWTSAGTWKQLFPTTSPDALYTHAMVTDTTRSKILLFGGLSSYYFYGSGGISGGSSYKNSLRNDVWEWDGSNATWTNRTPAASTTTPSARQYPVLAYDEGRQKMFLLDGPIYSSTYATSTSTFWEWDPISAGWALRDPGDALNYGGSLFVTYDSIRRREVMLTNVYDSNTGFIQTWELNAKGPTWYIRALQNTPSSRNYAAMAFDSGRGVAVLFGGNVNGTYSDETWEYQVTGLGLGEGCTSAFASTCASGNCVDGVCCESATCSGLCKSCNVAGSEGTCVLAQAGSEVSGSCSNGKACDGSGNCKNSNGQACTSEVMCASNYCVDGVCCDGACAGTCVSCNLAGRTGQCSPYPAGTDPQSECGKGTGVCKSTCDGVGSCAFPQSAVACDTCMTCDGAGTCSMKTTVCSSGGTGGYWGSGGYASGGRGGSGGYTSGSGGRGGSGGYTSGSGGRGGSGGYFSGSGGRGGSGGYFSGFGGQSGLAGNISGFGGNISGSGGKADAGSPKGGSSGASIDGGDGITSAYLHRPGCSCELGNARAISSLGLSGPLLLVGAILLRRRSQRFRGSISTIWQKLVDRAGRG